MTQFETSSILRNWLSVRNLPHRAVLGIASARQSAVGSCEIEPLVRDREVNGLLAKGICFSIWVIRSAMFCILSHVFL